MGGGARVAGLLDIRGGREQSELKNSGPETHSAESPSQRERLARWAAETVAGTNPFDYLDFGE